MKYIDYERTLSRERLRRYILACRNNKRNAMILYRYNLKLSKEMFAIISCFEVALRNKIDTEMRKHYGNDWLRDSILPGGIFYNDARVEHTKSIIEDAYNELKDTSSYAHSKLISKMFFGTWKYMFNNVQYSLSGRYLLDIFPNKPKSTRTLNINNTFIFYKLVKLNDLRNRIAHHESICFNQLYSIDIQMVKYCYDNMIMLFEWMDIDHKKLLYGFDHIGEILQKIKNINYFQKK